MEERNRRRLRRVRTGQAAAVSLGLKTVERKACCLAVLEHNDHIALVIARQYGIHRCLALVHAQLASQIIAQHGCLAVLKVIQMRLICLLHVGEENNLRLVGRLGLPDHFVAVFEFMFL